MPLNKYPVCSGDDLVKAFKSLGYEFVGQKGSHMKLRKYYENERHTIVVPRHKELDRGTLKSILRKVGKYIPEAKILDLLRK